MISEIPVEASNAMATTIEWEATIEDLARAEGKAELVDGKVRRMSPSGFEHGFMSVRILLSLVEYAKNQKNGRAFGDNVGFLCDLAHRKSFSPDVAYYDAAIPENRKKFLPQPPLFAVEIRSESDYGASAEKEMSAKRADYFAAGTLAVWDVDADGPVIVRLYLASNPQTPVEFGKGDIAHAEPVLPGWRLAVDEILAELDRS
jgi:Uma2 family endonuclease